MNHLRYPLASVIKSYEEYVNCFLAEKPYLQQKISKYSQ